MDNTCPQTTWTRETAPTTSWLFAGCLGGAPAVTTPVVPPPTGTIIVTPPPPTTTAYAFSGLLLGSGEFI